MHIDNGRADSGQRWTDGSRADDKAHSTASRNPMRHDRLRKAMRTENVTLNAAPNPEKFVREQ
jgi:hypothetical protein